MSTASNSSVSRHVTGNPVVRIAHIRDIDFRVILEFFFIGKCQLERINKVDTICSRSWIEEQFLSHESQFESV